VTRARRFFDVLRRDLGCTEARLASASEHLAPDPRTLVIALGSERVLVLGFEAPLDDRAELERRAGVWIEAFHDLLGDPEGAPPPRDERPATLRLHDELVQLCEATGAFDALVIDATSPFVWGSALREERYPVGPKAQVVSLEARRRGVRQLPVGTEEDDTPSERVVRRVREHPDFAGLGQGARFAVTSKKGEGGYVARSFASVYALVLAYDGPVDELRAERALQERLERIERLVVALPPDDPTPLARSARARRP
jgi:hypothetical protein